MRIEYLNIKLEHFSVEERLLWAIQNFGEGLTLASSLGPQSLVLTYYLTKMQECPDIFFLDTGRLPNETYSLLTECMEFFGIRYRIFFPDHSKVEKYQDQFGPNGFYRSRNLRKQCCQIRKLDSMKRALSGYDIWLSGARRTQTKNRDGMDILECDHRYGLLKLNPLADWQEDQVWEFIDDKQLPYNQLHNDGYVSIGCAPCTRAVGEGECSRSGRWWWEQDSDSECGLNVLNTSQSSKSIDPPDFVLLKNID